MIQEGESGFQGPKGSRTYSPEPFQDSVAGNLLDP